MGTMQSHSTSSPAEEMPLALLAPHSTPSLPPSEDALSPPPAMVQMAKDHILCSSSHQEVKSASLIFKPELDL